VKEYEKLGDLKVSKCNVSKTSKQEYLSAASMNSGLYRALSHGNN
jgi:hypothetical protein